jgi:hypothetical protein
LLPSDSNKVDEHIKNETYVSHRKTQFFHKSRSRPIILGARSVRGNGPTPRTHNH